MHILRPKIKMNRAIARMLTALCLTSSTLSIFSVPSKPIIISIGIMAKCCASSMAKTFFPRLNDSMALSCNRFIMMAVLQRLITRPINKILAMLQSNQSAKSQTLSTICIREPKIINFQLLINLLISVSIPTKSSS
jgi:hypothetical protein